MTTDVMCVGCGLSRALKHPKQAGSRCRSCTQAKATTYAAKANTTPTTEKFARYSRPLANGCWMWTGYKYLNGYGGLTHMGGQVLAHRWSYEHHVGEIPEGLQIDHLCRNRACVNPQHMEPVTAKENIRRAMRSHCVNGHEFSEENTWIHKGKRYCRACRYQRCKARRESQKNDA